MSMKKMNERKRTFLLMTIPVVALFFCFNTLPLLKGVMYSFTNFKGFGSYDWVGVRNYMDLFQDVRVGNSYWFPLSAGNRNDNCSQCDQSAAGNGSEQ